jgi:carboxylesterase
MGDDVRWSRTMLEWYAQPQFRPFTLTHDAGDDRPGALMIHGFTGSPDDMRATAAIAHRAGFDVEALCLPGHGADIASFREIDGSDWHGAVADAWQRFRCRYRRAALIGYSLGGALAIHAAVERPPDAMLLLSPLIRIADRRAFVLPVLRRVIREIAPFGRLDFSDPQARGFFAKTMPGLDIDRPEVQRAIREETALPVRLINECRLVGREAGRLAARVKVPVTIIQGRPDHIVGHRDARWLVDHLGGRVTYHELPGNHLIPFATVASWPAVRHLLEDWFADRYAEMMT